MKKLTFLMAIFFASAMVFGQQLNYTSIDQWGNANDAYVTQDATNGSATSGTNVLSFNQYGDNNGLYATQFTDGVGIGSGPAAPYGQVGNYSYGLQQGDANVVTLDQNSEFNRSYLTQSGVSNTMSLNQHSTANTALSTGYVDNYAKATQSGSWNDYTLIQTGNHNEQELIQGGYENDAWIDQYAILSVNISRIYQNGHDNFADLDQDVDRPDVGGSSDSKAEQNGDDNIIQITQVGEFSYNTSDIKQSADDNKAYLWQATNYSNKSTNTVFGDGDRNYLKVIQEDVGPGPAWY